MKRVLITGANSYIGESVRDYLNKRPSDYEVCVRDTLGWEPEYKDFIGFDVVFNVAGIAHIKESEANQHLYFDINRDLSINIASAAKKAGVKQFILLSTMSVYGTITGHISKDSVVNPQNAYGKSKAEADEVISKLRGEDFKFACLRPPMVYGKGCKGNYQKLRRVALKIPFFPNCKNIRSMIYIENLCEFVRGCIDKECDGTFFPQNSEYVDVAKMVKAIARSHNKKMFLVWIPKCFVECLPSKTVKKVLGNLTYEPVDLVDTVSFEDSIFLSEKE